MNTLVVVFHVFICVVLILVVLVQAGKDGGIGMMSGGASQTIFGSSGGANFFTRFTSATAALFMITSIILTVSKTGTKRSVFDNAKAVPAATTTPPPATTAAPSAAAGNDVSTSASPAKK